MRKITSDRTDQRTHLEREARTVANPLLVNNFDAILTFVTVDCLRQIKLRRMNFTNVEEKVYFWQMYRQATGL